jgi:hypothetical protein
MGSPASATGAIATRSTRVGGFAFAWSGVPQVLFIGVLALYVAFGLSLGGAPLQDLPDHLTRAHIMGDLLFNHGAQYGDQFAVKLEFSPYVGGDLLLASLDRGIGTAWTCRVWIAAVIGLLPLSVWFALGRLGAGAIAASTAGVLALYVATDHFFILGLTNYLFGVACAFFAYGWFCTAARSGRIGAYVIFVLLLLLCYAVHLTSLIFTCAITAVSAALWVWTGKVSLRRAALLMSAPVVLGVLQLATGTGMDLIGAAAHVASGAAQAGVGAVTGWRGSKLAQFGFPAERFDLTADVGLFALLIATAAFPMLLAGRRAIGVSAEPLIIGCALVLLYLFIPATFGGVWYAGVRPLQYALLFLIIAGVRSAELRPGVQASQFALAVIVVVVNLAYLAFYVLPVNAAMGRYKAVAASIPPGAAVLPIDAEPAHTYRPFLHAGAYATLNNHGLTPYLFASDNTPQMDYFQYRKRPYAPVETWYTANASVPWNRLAHEYQYVLVTVPWAAQKIPVAYTVVARNDVAALLRLEERQAEQPNGRETPAPWR